MELICRHNAGNVEIRSGISEHITVKTVDNSAWEHIGFCDFIDHTVLNQGKFIERIVRCNAWRRNYKDRWNYLQKGEYIVGIVFKEKLYILLKDNSPVIQHDEHLNVISKRPLASVHSIFEAKSKATAS